MSKTESFNPKDFTARLTTRYIGQNVIYRPELDSTNRLASELPAAETPNGTLVITDNQYAGKGQHRRGWSTAKNANLTFTLFIKPNRADGVHLLTQIAAYSLITYLSNHLDNNLKIKWPNDVLASRKKFCGILTETSYSGNNLSRVLIGVGINVNQTEFPGEYRHPATSLRLLQNGNPWQREELLAGFLSHFEPNITAWEHYSNDQLKAVNNSLIGYGKWVRLNIDGKEPAGKRKILGVDKIGKLQALTEEHELESYEYEQIRIITD